MSTESDAIHTGDDELLDALTGVLVGLEGLIEGEHGTLSADQLEALEDVFEDLKRADELRVAMLKENARLNGLLNTPELHDFAKAVVLEAAHQRMRWPESDAEKTDADWFWLIGYLAGKALNTPIAKDLKQQRYVEEHDAVVFGLTSEEVREKRLHRIITVAAAAANWHSALLELANHEVEGRS